MNGAVSDQKTIHNLVQAPDKLHGPDLFGLEQTKRAVKKARLRGNKASWKNKIGDVVVSRAVVDLTEKVAREGQLLPRPDIDRPLAGVLQMNAAERSVPYAEYELTILLEHHVGSTSDQVIAGAGGNFCQGPHRAGNHHHGIN